VLEDDQGTANSFTVDLTALGTYPEPHTGIFRTPRYMPPRVYLRLKLTTALSSGTSLFLDEVILAAMTELYAGGPLMAAFTGAKNFRVGDTAEITVLNNREGELHEWLHRLLNLGGSRILFPVASPGTFDDTLIA
jgi:polyphosphate kinase